MKNYLKTATHVLTGLFFLTSCILFQGSDFPHITEKISFTTKQFTIYGELWIPKKADVSPLVIMVHGDGPARSSYYSTIKNSFLKAGYAVLMWDKPGYGKSTGKFSNNRLREERAEILLAAVEKMKAHDKIDNGAIGLWGISQAGYVIPRILNRTSNISFMILVGVGGENGIHQTAYFIREQLICEGASEARALKAEKDFINLFYAKTYEEYYQSAKPLVDDPQIKEMGFVTAIWSESEWVPIEPTREGFYDPIEVMEQTKIPTLVFFGELDKNVNPFQGGKAYNEAFRKAGNPNFMVKLIKGADHNIIISETGCAKERRNRSGKGWSKYDLEYLKIMEEWLRNLRHTNP